MKKEFATITTLRLDWRHKDKLERIITAQLGVSAKTQAGAIRQMVGKWEALVADVDKLEAENQRLLEENQALTEIIESHVGITRKMQAVCERNHEFQKKFDLTRCIRADDHGKNRQDN